MWQEGILYRIEGRQLQQQGNLEQAADAYRKAIFVKPDYAEAYNDLGAVLESMGDVAGAEDAYKTALKFKPDLGPAHSNLALLYEETGRIQEAAVHWGARSRIGPPDNPWTVKAREKLLKYHFKIPETAEEKADERVKAIRVAIETGKADLKEKQYDKAISEFEQALKIDPTHTVATRLLRSAKTRARMAQAREVRDLEAARGRLKREVEKSKRKEEGRKAESEKMIRAARRIEAEKRAEEIKKKAAVKERIREKERVARQTVKAAQETEAMVKQTKAAHHEADRVSVKAAVPPPVATEQISTPAPSEAQAIARQIIAEKSKLRGQTAQELNHRAAVAMREDRYQDAVDTYKQTLMLDPGNRSAKQGLERAQKALAKEAR